LTTAVLSDKWIAYAGAADASTDINPGGRVPLSTGVLPSTFSHYQVRLDITKSLTPSEH
jgi:hypothetical protein